MIQAFIKRMTSLSSIWGSSASCAIGLTIALLGCVQSSSERLIVESRVDQFFDLMNRKKFRRIERGLRTDGYKKRVSNVTFTKFLVQVSDYYGPCADHQITFFAVGAFSGPSKVRTFRECKNGELREEFLWQVDYENQSVRLHEYNLMGIDVGFIEYSRGGEIGDKDR